MNRKVKIGIIVIIVIMLAYFAFTFLSYNHAEKTATDYLNGTDKVNVTKIDNGLFVDGYGNDTALIFYPGAKVEYTSYLPMFCNLASKGVDCYLVEMPLNFAIFGENEADSIIDKTNYTHYFMSGHSLGGYVASSYLSHTNRTDGLILLAAYPTEKIDKPVLSIYGTKDNVLNMEKYNESKPLMSNLTEYVINGGNHAQFGYYGNQSGDNSSKITPQNQQSQSVEVILDFIDELT